jgi:hypothetical protein
VIRLDEIVPNALYTEKEAAPLLGRSTHWLQRHRWLGTGPVYIRNGRPVRYRGSDLITWLESGRVEPARVA